MRSTLKNSLFSLTAAGATASVAMLLMLSGPASAEQSGPVKIAPPGTDETVQGYWTPDRLAHAKPLDLQPNGQPVHGRAHKGEPTAPPQIFHAGEPTMPYDPSMSIKVQGSERAPDREPPLYGGSGYPFTTDRLYPQNAGSPLHADFPYATVGHLFFTINGAGYQCSASIIRRNTIATAGHCVADGNGHYYTNWLFIPAQNGTVHPYGSWTWATAWTSSAWWSGGGGVPNEQDDAVIVLNTRTISGVNHKVGDYTGYLGYEWNTPQPTAITQLGYPCNLDGCNDPVATYSQMQSGPNNNFEWGTASFGGASGGPEIQDFGQAPSGVPNETLGGNIVISSTSYTYSTSTMDDGGSIFYAPGQNGERTMGDLLNWACTVNGC